MSMTSRERVLAALQHRPPDRTPVFEYVILPEMAQTLLGRPFAEDPEYWTRLEEERGFEAAVRQMAIDRVDLASLLGHDLMYVLPNPLPRSTDYPSEPTPDFSGHDPVENLSRRNAWFREHPGKWQDEAFLIYLYLREEMEKRGLDLPLLVPAYAHGVWTDMDLMQAMVLEPEAAREHYALATERTLPLVEKYLALEIEQIGVGGDFAGNRPLISPKAYHEYIVPEVRRVSRAVHAGGAYSVNASDGNLWSVIEDFLIGCEVDGYIEIDYHATMHLDRLKAEFGDRIAFYGNLDCGNILSFGSEEDVRRHTLDCIEAGLEGGGHILTASNAITESVPLKNYRAMVNAYRDRFGLEKVRI